MYDFKTVYSPILEHRAESEAIAACSNVSPGALGGGGGGGGGALIVLSIIYCIMRSTTIS